MWTASATHMIARLTGSTLFANHNLLSILTVDHRSVSTTSDKTPSDDVGKNLTLITKMRDLRARGPYALFLKDNYHDVRAKHPDFKLGDISKKIAEVWKSLSDEKKQDYIKKFQDQKTTYEQEKQRLSPNDLQTIDADEKARRIEHRVKKRMQQLPTKRPRSAYAHFLTTLDRGEADIKDYMKGAAQRWSQISVQDKQKFEDLHQEEKQQYARALVAWAASNEQPSRRSSSLTSSQTKDEPVKKTRARSAATGKRTVKKRVSASSKTAASTTKSTKKKSTKTASDKEASSSSSSDDDSSRKTKKSSKSTDSTKS